LTTLNLGLNPQPEKTIFCAINWNKKKEIGERQDFLAKLHKKVQFQGVILKYVKKIDFNIRLLAHLFKKKLQLCNFWENSEPIFRSGI